MRKKVAKSKRLSWKSVQKHGESNNNNNNNNTSRRSVRMDLFEAIKAEGAETNPKLEDNWSVVDIRPGITVGGKVP